MPTATGICKSMEKYPGLEHFMRNITNNNILITTKVHQSFYYPREIVEKQLWAYYGIFIDYFIRRCICEFRHENFYDPRVQKLKNPEEHFDDIRIEIFKEKKFAIDLAIIDRVENIKNDTFDVLEDLTIYSSYHFIRFFEDKLNEPFVHYDKDYLKCIQKHIEKSFDFKKTILSNPDLDCQYFTADCDIIYNDFIMVIRNSRFRRTKPDFYQLFLYAFGYYKKSGIKIKKFKFYSTLLGLEYVITLRENLNFFEFERILINEVFKTPEVNGIMCDDDLDDNEKQVVLTRLETYVQKKMEKLNIQEEQDSNLEEIDFGKKINFEYCYDLF